MNTAQLKGMLELYNRERELVTKQQTDEFAAFYISTPGTYYFCEGCFIMVANEFRHTSWSSYCAYVEEPSWVILKNEKITDIVPSNLDNGLQLNNGMFMDEETEQAHNEMMQSWEDYMVFGTGHTMISADEHGMIRLDDAGQYHMVDKSAAENKCTCGVDKVGGGLHSSWCDKQ